MSSTLLAVVASLCIPFLFPHDASAEDRILGDIDGDRVLTVLDLVKLNNLAEKKQSLGDVQEVFADLNGDGFVNELDREAMLRGILRTSEPRTLPPATVRSTSPARAETGVAITRETILYFTIPLHPDTALDTSKLFARFGDKKILSRVALSADRTKATLFLLEPMPAGAEIEVVFDSGGVMDLLGRPLDGDGDGEPGGIFTTTFRTVSIVPVSGTGVVGRVLASEKGPGGEDVPIEGAIITVDGAEETMRAVTDADGQFVLSPAPTGIFFVHIDGRQAEGSSFPDGDYYPFVGKKWFAEAGRLDNPAGDADDTPEGGGTGVIYLPLVKAGSLQTVSATQETVITAPEGIAGMQGVELRVPANSLFADDGTPGGRVGIAPVEPDRIPSPLPPGLDLPLVITVQTDGPSNFDRPVPLTFPNLPDPVTGKKLGPGEKSALWSFNHDTGEWEVVGPMTVTEDGEFVVTDAGVGLLQPGWHGTQPGTEIDVPVVYPPLPPLPPLPPPSPSPSPSPTPTPCPGLGWNEFIKIGAEAASCGAQFTNKKDAILALIGVVKSLQSSYETVRKLFELAKKPQMPLDEAKSVLESIRNVRATFKTDWVILLDLVKKTGGPTGLIDPIFECAGNLLEILLTLCGGPIGNPDECKPTGWKKYACKGIEYIKAIHSKIKFWKDLAENRMKEILGLGFVSTFDLFVDKSIVILEAFIASAPIERSRLQSSFKAEQIYMEESDRLALAEALGELVDHMSVIPKAAEASQQLLDEVNRAIEANFELIEALNNATLETAPAVAGKTYYLLTTDQWEQRGVVAAGGRLSVALPPDIWPVVIEVYNPSTDGFASVTFATDSNGVPTTAPVIVIEPLESGLPDGDNDGLVDRAERIVGTDPTKPDTDEDGISDYAELRAGGDPLSGRAVATGVIASLTTTAPALDVSASNTVLAAALGANGVGLFDVTTPSAPVRLREIRTGGHVRSVAVLPGYVAAAAGSEGLAVIRLGRSADIALSRKVPFQASAVAVTTDGSTVFVGLDNGSIVAVELSTGTILGEQKANAAVQDLNVGRDELYVRTAQGLEVFGLEGGEFVPKGKVSLETTAGAGGRRFRISLLDKLVLATNARGYQVVDVADPSNPQVVGEHTDGQFGWKQIVANGSGLALAASSPSSTDDGEHNVTLYNLRDGAASPRLLTRLATPGLAAAVCIYNGLAYVADSEAGVQVVNYLAADNQGQPPQITLESNFNLEELVAEEGKRMRLTALVGDDLQVRNVEFFLNGELLVTDGNSPFETSFTTPSLALAATFKINARVYDTGGNMAETGELEIELVPDATPPTVRQVVPARDAFLRLSDIADQTVALRFSEPMNADLLAQGVRIVWAGPDRTFETEDDVDLEYTAEYFDTLNLLRIGPEAAFVSGKFRVTAGGPAADLAGNTLEDFTSDFRIISNDDTDQDGLPDEYEDLLGTDPLDAYSWSKRYPWLPQRTDGQYDWDSDGLTNATEFLLGTDPNDRDTDNNGIGDGQEDSDRDGLNDVLESRIYGTNPLQADTDGDGLDDASELAEGTDPLVKNAMQIRISSMTASFLNALIEKPDPDLLRLDVASPTVSYLNDVAPDVLDEDAINIYSRPVSYLNAVPSGAPTEFSILSLPVSYRNETTDNP